mmetsp:Transcript_34529/g.75376  ORF Transcript_34529/g.75376 Transcript_34529/m.75376 type:complete len:245 (-) Transcript_34529:88-822(-)
MASFAGALACRAVGSRSPSGYLSPVRRLTVLAPPSIHESRMILNVEASATQEEIRAAYFAAAKTCHPDVVKVPDSGHQFMQLRASYELLLTEACRGDGSGPQCAAASRPRPQTWEVVRAAGRRSRSMKAPSSIKVQRVGDDVGSLDFDGAYRRTDDFNMEPAYEHQSCRFYLFWSQLFNDWKIADKLAEKGVCLAFTDLNRNVAPWSLKLSGSAAQAGQTWVVWDPVAHHFGSRSLLIRPVTEM